MAVLLVVVVNNSQIRNSIPKIVGPPPKQSLKRGTPVLKSLGPGLALFGAAVKKRVRHYL